MTENIEKEDIQVEESSKSPVTYGADFWEQEEDEEESKETNDFHESNAQKTTAEEETAVESSKLDTVKKEIEKLTNRVENKYYVGKDNVLNSDVKEIELKIVDLNNENDIQNCYEQLIRSVESANQYNVYIELCKRGKELGNEYAKVVLLLTDNCTTEEKEKCIQEILGNRDEETLLILLKQLNFKDEELSIKILNQIQNEHEAYSKEFLEFIKIYRLKAGLNIDNFNGIELYEDKEDECKLIAELFCDQNNSLLSLHNFDFIYEQIVKYKGAGKDWTSFLIYSDNTPLEIKEKLAIDFITSGEIMMMPGGKAILRLLEKTDLSGFDDKDSGIYELEKIYFDVKPYKKTYIMKLEPYPETYKYVSKCFISEHNELLTNKMFDFVAKCQIACSNYEQWLQNLLKNYSENRTIVKNIYDLCVSDDSQNVLNKIDFIKIAELCQKEDLDIEKLLIKYLEITDISELSIPALEKMITIFKEFNTEKLEEQLKIKVELQRQEEEERQRLLEEERKKQLELEKKRKRQEAKAFADNVVQLKENKKSNKNKETTRAKIENDTSKSEWNDLQKLLNQSHEVKEDDQVIVQENQYFDKSSLDKKINGIIYALFIVLFIVLLIGFVFGGINFLGVMLQTIFLGIIIYGVAKIGLGKKKDK